jgi:hypothetical protein
MSLRSKAASWVKHWTRLEPGFHELSLLRDEGDLDSLTFYLSEPGGTRGLRRRATMAIASMSPGGGSAGASRPTDPAIIPVLAPLLENDPDSAVRRSAAFGLRRTGDPAAAPALERALSSRTMPPRYTAFSGWGASSAVMRSSRSWVCSTIPGAEGQRPRLWSTSGTKARSDRYG